MTSMTSMKDENKMEEIIMTREEKQLLLIDICARLLYHPNGVKLNKFGNEDIIVIGYTGRFIETLDDEVEVERVRLYLRPMSSMTEEEQREFGNLVGLWKDSRTGRFANCIPNLSGEFGKTLISEVIVARAIDWLNENHFDYRGLIPMGLALEAPSNMYKTK